MLTVRPADGAGFRGVPTLSDPSTAQGERIQLHLVHPYSVEIRDNAKVKRYLDGGYRIAHLQRVTDREVLVTLAR